MRCPDTPTLDMTDGDRHAPVWASRPILGLSGGLAHPVPPARDEPMWPVPFLLPWLRIHRAPVALLPSLHIGKTQRKGRARCAVRPFAMGLLSPVVSASLGCPLSKGLRGEVGATVGVGADLLGKLAAAKPNIIASQAITAGAGSARVGFKDERCVRSDLVAGTAVAIRESGWHEVLPFGPSRHQLEGLAPARGATGQSERRQLAAHARGVELFAVERCPAEGDENAVGVGRGLSFALGQDRVLETVRQDSDTRLAPVLL